MHQTYMTRQVLHALDEVEQILAVGVGGIAGDGLDAGADVEPLAVEFHPAAAWPILPDVTARRPEP